MFCLEKKVLSKLYRAFSISAHRYNTPNVSSITTHAHASSINNDANTHANNETSILAKINQSIKESLKAKETERLQSLKNFKSYLITQQKNISLSKGALPPANWETQMTVKYLLTIRKTISVYQSLGDDEKARSLLEKEKFEFNVIKEECLPLWWDDARVTEFINQYLENNLDKYSTFGPKQFGSILRDLELTNPQLFSRTCKEIILEALRKSPRFYPK